MYLLLSCLFRFHVEDTLTDNGIVFAKLIELLTACSPNKLAYRKGVAIRESEEAALLIQAAVPLKGMFHALFVKQVTKFVKRMG